MDAIGQTQVFFIKKKFLHGSFWSIFYLRFYEPYLQYNKILYIPLKIIILSSILFTIL